MKKTIIGGAVLFIVGLLIGFVPQYVKLVEAHHQIDTLRQQLDVTTRMEAIDSFRNRAALIYTQTSLNNFTVALDMASTYFTDLRTFTDQATDVTLKQGLENILSSRDAIIAGLAKADPTVNAKIQALFLEMQKIK